MSHGTRFQPLAMVRDLYLFCDVSRGLEQEVNGTTVFGLIQDEPNKGRLLRCVMCVYPTHGFESE